MPPTVTHFALMPEGRSATLTILEDKVTRVYSRVYVIKTQARASEVEMVHLEHPLLPEGGSIHPDNPFARVKSRSAKSAGGPLVWHVTVTWDTETSGQEEEEKPIDRSPVVTVSSINYTRPLERDQAGNPITNTVGEPFDPGLETEDMRSVVHIRRNVAFVDPGFLSSFRRHVNAGQLSVQTKVQLWGWASGTLLFHGWSVSEQSQNGVDFLQLGLTFQEKGAWNPRPVLNTGYRYFELFAIDGDPFNPDVELRNVSDAGGADLNQPRLLTESGFLAPLPLPANFNPFYVKFDEFPTRAFQQLMTF